ncbi:MAG: toxin [Candidatus Aenigmarchaeota archaeon]|nr:toxin [Candidatus Aenigmarchaeota archaeon]
MYDVVFDPLAIHFLNNLEKAVKERIFKKLRIGDYRVIADIDQTLKKIQITLIGHRKNVYKRML